ncbi:MAG: mannose-1-phosphate guanylyltransferase [Candidatus Omnitrophica bacterium]|nr:mannose-1-phosphate guanylyltransferase [Candidatus Omnitrophota bacterium]
MPRQMPGGISVTFVIMAGGRGERLWPLVRAARPKVCLCPEGKCSLLQATIDRLRPAWPKAQWLIITTPEQAAAVRADVPQALRRRVLVEPAIKNTAACMMLAAVAVARRDPNGIMVAVPADQWVDRDVAFKTAVRAAIRAAISQDTIALVGIPATQPHTGFGYLCAGTPVEGFHHPAVFHIDRFIEKPTRARARRLIAKPRTYWNSGIFVGSAENFLTQMTEWLPEHARQLVPVAARVRRWNDATLRRAYRKLIPISFDYGVMDHLQGGVVVEGHFSWADVGSWDTWMKLGYGSSHHVSVDSNNITVISQQDDHLVATLGVHDLVIVRTPTATLICHPTRAQAVREVVKKISADPRLASYR